MEAALGIRLGGRGDRPARLDGGVGVWGVRVMGRSRFALSGSRGFGPEIGIGALAPQPGLAGGSNGGQSSSGAGNAIDALPFPNLRTFGNEKASIALTAPD